MVRQTINKANRSTKQESCHCNCQKIRLLWILRRNWRINKPVICRINRKVIARSTQHTRNRARNRNGLRLIGMIRGNS